MLVLSVSSPTFGLQGATTLESQEVIARIDRAQHDREQKLAGYVAIEHYVVRNSHFQESAELETKVSFQKGLGKSYQVLRRNGPRFLQDRVIDHLLKEEAALSRNPKRRHTVLTSANYSMRVRGMQTVQGEECYVIHIRPRMRKFSLIEGMAWVDADDFSLLRIEGRPAASPSFWTGRPYIEREYTILDGLSFPKHSRATSKGLFAGKSELVIDYSQYVIFREPVLEETQ